MQAVTRTFIRISLVPLIQTNARLYQSVAREHMKPDYEVESKILLSDENRQRCLQNMKASAPINIKLKGNASEMGFAAVLIAICTDENKYVTDV